MLIIIASTIPSPPIHIDSGDPHLRGFYSERYLDSDGVTAVMPGNGQSGFYYDIQCSLDGEGNLVIPEFVIHTTDDGIDIQTSRFTGQLYIDDAASVIIFGFPQASPGWMIPASFGSSVTWNQLDVFNQGAAQLGFNYNFYLTAAATIALITSNSGTENTLPKTDVNGNLIDSSVTDDGTDIHLGHSEGQTSVLGAVQMGDFDAALNGSYIDVNDTTGRADLFAGADSGAEYAGVAAVCAVGIAQIFLQATDYSYLFGENGIVKLGDGAAENNGTQIRIDDPANMIIQRAKDAVPDDDKIGNEEACLYLDAAADKLKIRVRYADGTYKTGEVALV